MTKPVVDVTIEAPGGGKRAARAVVDSGSFHTVVRQDVLPEGAVLVNHPKTIRTAEQGGSLAIAGSTLLVVEIAGKMIEGSALVAPTLQRELIIGASWMQMWDISILNDDGRTTVEVGNDLRDPDLTAVELLNR